MYGLPSTNMLSIAQLHALSCCKDQDSPHLLRGRHESAYFSNCDQRLMRNKYFQVCYLSPQTLLLWGYHLAFCRWLSICEGWMSPPTFNSNRSPTLSNSWCPLDLDDRSLIFGMKFLIVMRCAAMHSRHGHFLYMRRIEILFSPPMHFCQRRNTLLSHAVTSPW